jgi:uncharacterized protein YabN with tetrapyrrole methylase and pyrophosphatase domain
MALEERRFDFADVVDAITRKMVRRHPHVFGDASRAEFQATDIWGRIKDAEKAERNRVNRRSRFEDVPLALPALTRAVKLQKRAARVGFDWPSVAPVLDKAEEELDELKAVAAMRDEAANAGATKRASEELGDLLSPLRISRAISASIRKERYATRTRNSCAASGTSKTLWPGTGGKPKTRRSKRWIGFGTRRRPQSGRRKSIPRRA